MNYICINDLAKLVRDYKNAGKENDFKKRRSLCSEIYEILEAVIFPPGVQEFDFDLERSTNRRLVFSFKYYHSPGMFTSDHKVVIKACLADAYSLEVLGKKEGDTKKIMYDHFDELFIMV